MGIFEKFKNTIEPSELKRKKSHLNNLYSIALADGRLDNSEFDFLFHVGQNKLYLPAETVQQVVNYSDDISFYIPKNSNERIDQLKDYVFMALVDGNINEREISTCKLLAVKLGFRPQVIDAIFNDLIKSLANGIAKELVINELMEKL
jgi:uncharacterized tellurite resistance protein B-like protein